MPQETRHPRHVRYAELHPKESADEGGKGSENNRWQSDKGTVRNAGDHHDGNSKDEGPPEEPGHIAVNRTHGVISAETPDELMSLHLVEAHKKAAGLPAVLRSVQYVFGHATAGHSIHGLSVLNQKGGIDCMSCAWPEPDGDRSFAEFCENGAKALGHEMDTRRCGPEFFAQHSVAELSTRSDYWLEQQGRLTHPMILRTGATHYEPIEWADAFAVIAAELNNLESADHASFYTSGRASNEAAFCYQLFVRQFGTNNLPDCSNMCHESSGSALTATIGIGKGTVKIDDFEKSQLIIILGQNPGTNHPRMLTTLQAAKKKGAKMIAVNPLPEAGLLAFMNPQQPLGMLGVGTALADLFLQVRINGDIAVLKGIMKEMLAAEDAKAGSAFDWNFITTKTQGVGELVENIRAAAWEDIVAGSGITREQIKEAANLVMGSERIICCWAMGLTQQKDAVQSIQEIVNLLLLRGSMGKPGAGACPVRGHSNVQGDRTMGVWERPQAELIKRLRKEFDFNPPEHKGFDSVETIKAMHEGKVKVFFQLGGNFLSAGPDTLYLQEAMSQLDLQVRVGTKLNRSDLVTGKQALILPCLGRSEIDRRQSGDQFISTENSMGVVEMSCGRFEPASPLLLSEVAILCSLANATLGERSTVNWLSWSNNYDLIRDRIAGTIPGCENYNTRVRNPGGFYLPNEARDNVYATDVKLAKFTVNPLPKHSLQPDELVMMTIRSHDQFNTTIYGFHDRYRGVHNERRVIFMNADDIASRGLKERQVVDITSHFNGQVRKADRFVVVPYSIPMGCCATYYPEGNVLVPVSSVADKSNQPTSKYVPVKVAVSTAPAQKSEAADLASTR